MADGPARNLGEFTRGGVFDWSIGIVVDNKDKDKSGHYKVRIVGLQDGIPIDQLSWIPTFIAGAAHQKVGFSPTGFLPGTHVHVKFGNPSDATNPMIMGTAINTAGDPQDGSTIDGQQSIKPETNSVAMEARGIDKAAWIKGSPPTKEDSPNSKDDDPQHTNSVQYAQDEKNGKAKQPKAKTIGTEAIAGSVLNLIQNMDGNASGAIKNAVQGLIKIKDINGLTSLGGLNNILGGALQQALTGLAGNMGLQNLIGSLQAALSQVGVSLDPNIQNALGQALQGMAGTILNQSQLGQLINTVAMAPASFVNLIDLLDSSIGAFHDMAEIDMSTLATGDIINVVQTIHDFIKSLETVDQTALAGYPLANLVGSIAAVLDNLDVTGNTDPQLIILIPQLSDIVNSSILMTLAPQTQQVLVDSVTRLQDQLLADLVLSASDQITATAASSLQFGIQSLITNNMMSVPALNALILTVMDKIRNSGLSSVLGQGINGQNILQNITSLLPQVGSMLQQTVNTFLPESVNDKQKVSDAAKKHAVAQAVLKKKMDAAKEIFSNAGTDINSQITSLQNMADTNTLADTIAKTQAQSK